MQLTDDCVLTLTGWLDADTAQMTERLPAPRGRARRRSCSRTSAWRERAAKGDRRAFEAIFQRYHQDLYRFCLAMVGNPQDAQDALQNTMVKVLRALPGEQREIKLKPWLYRIARNEAIEILRRRRDDAELEPELTPSGAGDRRARSRRGSGCGG